MRKIILAALAALLVLALGGGTAAALRSISVVGGARTVTATSRALTFTEEEGNFRVICEVILEVRLNAAAGKAVGSSVGSANVRTRNCSGGSVVVLPRNQPWAITFVSFTGTLPNITSVRLEIRRAEFLLEAFFGIARCLYSGNAQGTTGGGTNRITEIRADERRLLPLASEALSGVTCPRNGIFRGTFTVSPTVEIRLV
jgi:hypothetical protein